MLADVEGYALGFGAGLGPAKVDFWPCSVAWGFFSLMAFLRLNIFVYWDPEFCKSNWAPQYGSLSLECLLDGMVATRIGMHPVKLL